MENDKIDLIEPHIYYCVEDAIRALKLTRRVKWKVVNGELCRYTKKCVCPQFVIKNGLPVKIILKTTSNKIE